MVRKVGIIGSGFSGLAAAAVLAKNGFDVHVYEKNESFGGRARQFKAEGFTFDMGPSWYWMPDVFENFFQYFDKTTVDFYHLQRLDPSYTVIFGKDDEIHMPADYASLKALFEKIEVGSGAQLDRFLEEAEYKYKVGMEEYVWKPCQSLLEYADWKIVKSVFSIDLFSSISNQIRNKFSNEKIRKILEFPVLFLGATPQKTPALYSLMNYADIKLGTWYPMGGMYKIVEAFMDIGKHYGVTYYNNAAITSIQQSTIRINGKEEQFDFIVASADYHHVDQNLIQKGMSNYDAKYWANRTMAPSSLLFYIGLNTKLSGFHHHNLFFDEPFDPHATTIYDSHQWPIDPLFYMCIPSITDSSVAPSGCENIFLLIPISTELTGDDDAVREKYFVMLCDRINTLKGIDIRPHVIFKKTYCISDFKRDYNAFKGNAYGLANTLKQTAFLKPKLRSDHIDNLFFTGQLTLPGPGMPPAIISGQMVANLIIKKTKNHG